MKGGDQLELQQGFRFHPTDEELVTSYLFHKCASPTVSVPIITEIDFYMFETPSNFLEALLFQDGGRLDTMGNPVGIRGSPTNVGYAEDALIGAWTKSVYNLWAKRLRKS